MADANCTQIHSREFIRVLPLIVALERIERPTVTNLATDTGLTEKELESRLQALQGDYQVLVEKSGDAVYQVASWGLLPRHPRSEVERGVFSVKRDNPQDEQITFDIANNLLRIYGHRIAYTAPLDTVKLIKGFSGGQLRLDSGGFCANVQLSVVEYFQAEHYFLVIKKSQETMK
ncbi:hypothetical protein [Cellvibrio sp. pealriver]|uniref:hypothetical protein n=1 Tax=Cellvibrio sp. pealriver TaxID=1622269 RepID=UPI00066FB8A0|nr:hypothetical protein [Cellvibrio sp. pealriver]